MSKPVLISSLMGVNNEGLEALGPTEEQLPSRSSQLLAPSEMQVQHGESSQLCKGSWVTQILMLHLLNVQCWPLDWLFFKAVLA